MTRGRTLLVVSTRDDAKSQAAIRAGMHPRRDFDALQAALDADVLDAPWARTRVSRITQPLTLAMRAATRAGAYDAIFADGEHIGFPLAALLRLRRWRGRLTMIGHYLTPRKKQAVVRALRLAGAVDGIALHSTSQVEHARRMGFGAERTPVIPYQVDTEFWQPQERPMDDQICAAGREFRDYATLLDAARGGEFAVEIATGSPWSKRELNTVGAIPSNVQITSHSYDALRDMYARSRFVVVPLQDVDFQAGIITILEAMSMGKAVIVTRTRGQVGTVSGPLMTAGGIGEDVVTHPEQHPNGIYVPPGDAAALRRAIEHLLAHPDEAARMGANGRRLVSEEMSLERFAGRVESFIRGGSEPS